VIHYPYTDKHFNFHTFGARKYGTEMEITYKYLYTAVCFNTH